jgi:hypothetical protein
MKRITRRRLALATLAAAAIAAGGFQVVGSFASGGGEAQFAGARNATARYHSLDAATADGYGLFPDAQGIRCIDNQPVGGMGIHYVKGSLVFNPDGTPNTDLDPQHPEALVYAPNAAGQTRLAALEYIVFQSAWEPAGDVRTDLQLDPGAEPLRHPGVLLAPRLGLGAQLGWDAPPLESARALLKAAGGRGRLRPARARLPRTTRRQ